VFGGETPLGEGEWGGGGPGDLKHLRDDHRQGVVLRDQLLEGAQGGSHLEGLLDLHLHGKEQIGGSPETSPTRKGTKWRVSRIFACTAGNRMEGLPDLRPHGREQNGGCPGSSPTRQGTG